MTNQLETNIWEIVMHECDGEVSGEWVSVEDRMPEKGVNVIVDGGIAQYKGEYFGWYSITGIDWPGRPIEWDVTHWMPLPKLPND